MNKRKTLITSDSHWGHKNILSFNAKTRPYADTYEMQERMIAQWNAIVTEDDLVYHLGDFAFLNAQKATEIAKRLNGTKILVKGNHDSKLVKHQPFVDQFYSIHDYLEITHNGTKVVMMHYPLSEFNGMHRGAVHVHGHLHGAPSEMHQYRVMDVGMDATGNIVTDLDWVVETLLKRPMKPHGHIGVLDDTGGVHNGI